MPGVRLCRAEWEAVAVNCVHLRQRSLEMYFLSVRTSCFLWWLMVDAEMHFHSCTMPQYRFVSRSSVRSKQEQTVWTPSVVHDKGAVFHMAWICTCLHIAWCSIGFQYLGFSLQPATHNKISSSAYLRSEFRPTVEMLSVQTATLLLVLPQLCELHASLCWGFSWHVNFFGWSY